MFSTSIIELKCVLLFLKRAIFSQSRVQGRDNLQCIYRYIFEQTKKIMDYNLIYLCPMTIYYEYCTNWNCLLFSSDSPRIPLPPRTNYLWIFFRLRQILFSSVALSQKMSEFSSLCSLSSCLSNPNS